MMSVKHVLRLAIINKDKCGLTRPESISKIDKYDSLSKLKSYISEYDMPENNDDWYYKRYITDWGAFYHKAGWKLAVSFLNDATEQLRIVINNANWIGDESWRISTKQSYDMFFSYDWSVDNVKKSFKSVYKER